MIDEQPHIPVMLTEVLAALAPKAGELIVDGTFGAGGYTQAIIQRGADVLAFDRDPSAIAAGAELAAQAAEQLERLRAAAPGATPASVSPGTPPSPLEARPWLRAQVATAAASHATACVQQSGARAALLGSISAGLRGQDGRLA